MVKFRKINDVWSLYRYGNRYKAVYIKNAARRQKSKDLLFPELEGLPADVLPYAKHALNVVGFFPSEGEVLSGAPQASGEAKNNTDERFASSISRTKSRIYELALCNEFTHFCTFTQAPSKNADRYDLDSFRKRLAQYVRNQNKKRDVKIEYVLIPEEHEKGGWHMHGLLKGLQEGIDLQEFTLSERLPYRLRSMLAKGEKVYNWVKYSNKFGYFTATPIKDVSKCSAYICKYVTKNVCCQARENGRHLFFASQGLKGRETIIKDCIDEGGNIVRWCFDDVDFENEYVKVKWIENY